MTFKLTHNGLDSTMHPGFDGAVSAADDFLRDCPSDIHHTFAVRAQPSGLLVATVTNRRIVGTFTKQQWGGRKNDEAQFCGEEDFDATDAVLLLPLHELQELQDSMEPTDDIGRMHVAWDGPCEVTIVRAVCEYFGVDDVRDVTAEALEFARRRGNPQQPTRTAITLAVTVDLTVAPGVAVQTFVDNLTLTVQSRTAGAVVQSTRVALLPAP